MGSEVVEIQETQIVISCIKVHLVLCTQFLSLLSRICSVLPNIEATRPRCSQGIKALCLLQNATEKAKKLIQNCCESSKLYLALTGDAIVSRFERTKTHLVQSLSELQTLVPVALQLQITEILDDLTATKFQLDSHEKEAGKALKALLENDESVINSVGNSDVQVLQFAALKLHLTTQKDILTETRSIRNLLKEVTEEHPTKRETLKCLLYLLQKHKKLLLQGQSLKQHDRSSLSMKSPLKSLPAKCTDLEVLPGYAPDETPAGMADSSIPPEEFKCPLSLKLMYDPVVIASGLTFERDYIQKWFDDGHDTCPKTRAKLTDLSVRPNTAMRNLILRWSLQHGIIASDANLRSSASGSLETSSNSICSNASSLRDLHLQMDVSFSNLSLGSLDSSYSSDFSNPKFKNALSSAQELPDVDSHMFRFYHSIGDIRKQVLLNVSDLPWESQCRAVHDVTDYLINYKPSCTFISSDNFLEPLVLFSKGARAKQDIEALKAANLLLLAFLKSSRRETPYISEDIYSLLAYFLEQTDFTAETLAMMDILSAQQPGALSSIAASGALTSIIKLLDSDDGEIQVATSSIIYNLSLNIDTHSFKLASNWIPKLVPFLRKSSVAGICISIMENLCRFEMGRVCIVQTTDCIASIVELLEAGNSNDQERAIGILLSLCSQREQYCRLVLREGIEPSLCHVSVNGTPKAKVIASELLRLLMDVKREIEVELPKSNGDPFVSLPVNAEKKSSSKISGSFGRKIKNFFKKK